MHAFAGFSTSLLNVIEWSDELSDLIGRVLEADVDAGVDVLARLLSQNSIDVSRR